MEKMVKRTSGRKADEMRALKITTSYLQTTSGSVLIEMGNTRVICAASIEERVPPFLADSGSGWLTAEYAMLPMSTPTRNLREATRGRQGGRTHEIQRLIGRSLRAVTDLSAFGERTIYIDCDVIEADGGTRTASITGSFIALIGLFRHLKQIGEIDHIPIKDFVAAISVGIISGNALLDLDYEEDSQADVDANFIITGSGKIVEIQGTAEKTPFGRNLLDRMTDLAMAGVAQLTDKQRTLLGDLH